MIQDLTIIILTYNEEKKIERILGSVSKITNNIFVVDSFSTDSTPSLVGKFGIKMVQRAFDGYSEQRNWAQEHEPFGSNWVMHLDADEPLTPALIDWLLNEYHDYSDTYDGFMFSRRVYFMGKWIKYGAQYPNYHLRLFRKEIGRCEDKAYDQHFVLSSGKTKKVRGADIYNTVSDNLDQLIISHNKWASLEASEAIRVSKLMGEVRARIFGNPIERKRWLKERLYSKMPRFLRSFLYFLYLYLFRLGFLDGYRGLVYFVLQSFWFRFLVDAKIFELDLVAKEGLDE